MPVLLQVAGVSIAVFFDRATASGVVFDRTVEDGTILSFESGSSDRSVIDTQTGSQWDALTGLATGGPLAGTQLTQVPITYAFWFGWVAYHQAGSVYSGSQ